MGYRVAVASLAVLVASVLAPSKTDAQGVQTSALVGTVFDTSRAALPGAAVTLGGRGLIGGPQTSQADEAGQFRFPALAPGEYELTAELTGFAPRRHTGIKLPVDTTLTIDFELPLASLTESVQVTERAPLVDVKSSAAPIHLDRDLLQNLPVSREIANLINLAPGVAVDVAFGGSQRGNAMYVDGVDATEPKLQEPILRFNYNWVEEVQVAALGANAEYGEFTGVAANHVIRSGSNRFSGLAEYWTTRPSWIGSNTASAAEELRQNFEPLRNVEFLDTSAQLGGPVLADRLWFFSGFQYSKRDTQPPGYSGPDSTVETNKRFITKLSSAVAPSVRLEGFIEHGNPITTASGLGPFNPIETTVDETWRDSTWNVRMDWVINPQTLLEVRNGGYTAKYSMNPHGPGTRLGPPGHYDGATGLPSLNATEFSDNHSNQNNTAVSLTRYAAGFLGRTHELKFGLEYKWSQALDESGLTGGRSYYDLAGQPYSMYLWDGGSSQVTTRRTAAYVRDDWEVTDRVTVNLGVRADFNRGSVPLTGTIYSTDPISPRIGAAWDVTRDHKTVVRGHYGRYHDPLFTDQLTTFDRSHRTVNIFFQAVGPGQFEEVFRREPAALRRAVDDGIKQSFVDQYVVGAERELWRDTSIQMQYIHRGFGNFMGLIDQVSTWEPVERQDPGVDGEIGTSDDGELLTVYQRLNPQGFYLMTNPDGAYRRYDGLQFIANKRYSRNWQMQASYTWSRTRGNVGNRWHTNAGMFNLSNNTSGANGASSVFAYPNGRINADGRVELDISELKALGTYRVPVWGGVNVSGVYRLHSGNSWGRYVVFRGLFPNPFEPQQVRIEPVGTRRTPMVSTLDFRLEKTFELARGGMLGVFGDVFNLNNQGIALERQAQSGPRFGLPFRWSEPRTLRVGIRYTF